MRPFTPQCMRVLPQGMHMHLRSHPASRAFSWSSVSRPQHSRPPPSPLQRHTRRTVARLPGTSRSHSGCACHGSSRQPKAPQKVVAYIALGSNLGDRVAEIEKACRLMDAAGVRIRRTSSLWETEPMYVTDQDQFLNGVCEVETELEPLALLDALQAIEREMGRKKVVDKGPRNIDLDILLYGDRTVKGERLNVPHIGIPEREFVLRPLAE
jgi:2-amino-4-hydroxy-6-hydroxymethyldihydropteridine diphosphokinase / dihydropteroate synthase